MRAKKVWSVGGNAESLHLLCSDVHVKKKRKEGNVTNICLQAGTEPSCNRSEAKARTATSPL